MCTVKLIKNQLNIYIVLKDFCVHIKIKIFIRLTPRSLTIVCYIIL